MARVFPLILLWVISTLTVSCFHEPWRDEAQAWLVARYSPNLTELLFRASIEATGPFYYLLLWPFARSFPHGFPTFHFFISWVGTALAVWTLLGMKRLPWVLRILVAFGYLLGFEYACVARLYGWGTFFLFQGISADLEGNKKRSLGWFSLCLLVQLNFVFAVFAWVLARGAQRFLPLFIPLGLHLALLHWTNQVGSTEVWHFSTTLTKLGSTLMAPLVQMPGSMGLAGLVAFPLGMWVLSMKDRIAFGCAMIPFSALFLFRYFGHPQSRHAGALAMIWVVLVGLAWKKLSERKRQAALVLLALSFIGGLLGRGQDIFYPYSDGLAIAKQIQAESSQANEPPWLVTDYPYAGVVVAAILDLPLWFKGERIGRPFGPTNTVKSSELCPSGFSCYFIGDKPVAETMFASLGNWKLLRERSKWAIASETLYLYRRVPTSF